MITQDTFVDQIAAYVEKARKGQAWCDDIFSDGGKATAKNEFLFFIKPEITMPSDTIQLTDVLGLIYKKVHAFGLSVHHAKILSASYLERYNIIAQHYGVINQIASDAVAHMSSAAKDRFHDIYGCSVDEVVVLGGIEFLEKFRSFDAWSLGELWQSGDFQKLAGGTYCMRVTHDRETIYLINGFHPKQLQHFIAANRSIVVMTLSGDTSWQEARNDFIGTTMPANAKTGSLRRAFLDNQDSLGLSGISPSANGVHLSAGPVEALVELRRYNSDFSDPANILNWSEFSFGKKLLDLFSPEIVAQITSNVNILVSGKEVSVFDLTEEMDSDDALTVLAHHF